MTKVRETFQLKNKIRQIFKKYKQANKKVFSFISKGTPKEEGPRQNLKKKNRKILTRSNILLQITYSLLIDKLFSSLKESNLNLYAPKTQLHTHVKEKINKPLGESDRHCSGAWTWRPCRREGRDSDGPAWAELTSVPWARPSTAARPTRTLTKLHDTRSTDSPSLKSWNQRDSSLPRNSELKSTVKRWLKKKSRPYWNLKPTRRAQWKEKPSWTGHQGSSQVERRVLQKWHKVPAAVLWERAKAWASKLVTPRTSDGKQTLRLYWELQERERKL